MHKDFKDFFVDVINSFVNDLDTYGCSYSPEEDKIYCHSLKFAKGMLSFALIQMSSRIGKENYVYASDAMISEEFDKMSYRFYIKKGKDKRSTKINSLLNKHFSVIYRELSKCFPSNVIFIGTNVGKEDYDIYSRQQFMEGHPIDIRRLKKIRDKEGISEQNSGLAE